MHYLLNPVEIKLWDNIDKFKKEINCEYEYCITMAYNTKHKCKIDLLCLSERKKISIHKNDTIIKLIRTLYHELFHIYQIEYSNHIPAMKWISEELATNFANQYNYLFLKSSLEKIKVGTAYYDEYYTMVRFLLENYDKNYILKLLKDR